MIKRLTLIAALLTSALTGWGQLTVTGIVLDGKSAVPGIYVVEKGMTTGTTTKDDGTFSIEVKGRNATLVFSFIGMVTQEIPLEERTKLLVKVKWDCHKDFFDSNRIMIYANSGVLNNWLGGQVEITSPYLVGGVIKGLYSSQTNLHDNEFQNGQIEFAHFISNCDFNIDFKVNYRQISFERNFNSKAVSFETDLNLNKISLIAGYTHLNFNKADVVDNEISSGVVIGIETYFNLPLHPTVMAKMAIYKGRAEYQASIQSNRKRLLWFVKFYKLNSFNELSLGIGTTIGYRSKRQRK